VIETHGRSLPSGLFVAPKSFAGGSEVDRVRLPEHVGAGRPLRDTEGESNRSSPDR